LNQLKGQTVEGVTLKDLDREVSPRSKHKGYINFRIIGEENGKEVKIGVGVSQNAHGITVGAVIKYLTKYADFGLTRGCLVRAKSIPSSGRLQIQIWINCKISKAGNGFLSKMRKLNRSYPPQNV
jgi:hypothetical protein